MSKNSKTLKNIPDKERPREKAINQGIKSLTDSQLLAIVLRTGSKKNNVLELATTLLARFGNFRNLAQATMAELNAINGIGSIKAIEIKACLEIAKRYQQFSLSFGDILDSSRKVFLHFHKQLRDEKREMFFLLLLDSKGRLIKKELLSIGTLTRSLVHPREVFAVAIREAANKIILVHNHPSGDPTPSREDILLTKRLVCVGEIVGIEIVDHVIIADGGYTSFAEQSLLKD